MLLSLGIGMSFSLARGERETEEETVFADAFFLAGLGFHALVAFGVAFLCYLLYPDWMLMYLADRRKIPRWLIFCIFTAYFVMYVFGYLLVFPLRKKRSFLPVSVFIFILASIFALIFASFDRLWHVGTYEEYHRGEAMPMNKTKLFPLLSAAMPAAVAALIVLIKVLRRKASVI